MNQLCEHGALSPCWRCDGLDESDYLTVVTRLGGPPQHAPYSRPASRWALPERVEAVRNQDVPYSASEGDYYLTKRGRAWCLLARGPNWSLVGRVGYIPEGESVLCGEQRHLWTGGAPSRTAWKTFRAKRSDSTLDPLKV